jgi:antitoxin (DNA-binding transcriptional repressor) of toxin-antitoxin stability system
LEQGHPIEVTRRNRVVARLLPPETIANDAPPKFPDFAARAKKIFGRKRLKNSGAQMLRYERDSGF